MRWVKHTLTKQGIHEIKQGTHDVTICYDILNRLWQELDLFFNFECVCAIDSVWFLWHKVIASIYGTHPNGWDANMVVGWSHRCPWKAIAQVFQDFSPFVRLVVENGERIRFWEDHWWGNQSLCSQFAGLYRVIYVKNLTVSNALGNYFPLSWNFNFRRNLTDSEIDLLQRLMSSLSSMFFSLSLADSRAWSLLSSGLFSVKSFFLALSKVSNPILFLPAKFLWSSKAPSMVRALAWLVVHEK